MGIFITNIIAIFIICLIGHYLYNEMMSGLFGLFLLPFVELFTIIVCPIIAGLINIGLLITTTQKTQCICWIVFYILIPTTYILYRKWNDYIYSSNWTKYNKRIKNILNERCPNVELVTLSHNTDELKIYVKSKVLSSEIGYDDCEIIKGILISQMNTEKKIYVFSK